MLVVPAPLRAVRYINDPRHLWRDDAKIKDRRLKPRDAIVRLRAADTKSTEAYKKPPTTFAVTLKTFRAGDELFAYYGMKYFFE